MNKYPVVKRNVEGSESWGFDTPEGLHVPFGRLNDSREMAERNAIRYAMGDDRGWATVAIAEAPLVKEQA